MTCPNINSPEWTKLVAEVGELEAYRDFIITGDIRSADVVSQAIANRKYKTPLSDANRFIATYNKAVSNSAYITLANQLSRNLNVEYTLINKEDAKTLLEGAGQQYNGEAAFFFKDKVYLLPNEINETTVLHEFSHPLVFAIREQNEKLFESLYKEAIQIPGLQSYVETTYADKSALEQQMEAIVYGMTYANQQSPQAKSFLEKVVYALKQLFRKIFGNKVNVSKLGPNTSLSELVDMMRTQGFNLEYSKDVTDNLVMFIRDYTQFYEQLERVDSSKVEDMLGYAQSGARQIVSQIAKNKGLAERYPGLLKNEDNADILNIIIKELGIDKLSEQQKQEADDALLNSVAAVNIKNLAHSIAQLEELANKIEDVSLDIRESSGEFKIEDALTINRIAEAYNNIAQAMHETFREAGVTRRNAVLQALGNISQRYDAASANIKAAQLDFLTDFIYDKLEGVRTAQAKLFNDKLSKLETQKSKTTGDTSSIEKDIRKVKRDIEERSLTKDFIREVLLGRRGDLGDAKGKLLKNMMNLPTFKMEYLENFMNNPDIALGTFGMFLNDVYYKAEAEMKQNADDFLPIYKELEKVGLNPNNPQAFFETITYVDKVAKAKSDLLKEDTTGVEAFEVYSLLNPFKDYNFAIRDINSQIHLAKERNDTAALIELETKKEELLKFFNRPFTKAYYTAFEKFNTPVGRIASLRRKELYAEIENIDKDMIANLDMNDEDYQDLVNKKKEFIRQSRQLSSLVDELGNPKTGIDLEVAQLLKQHREDTKDFYEYEQIEGLFELRLKRFEEALVEQGLDPSSETFDLRREQWIEDNTVVSIKPEWRQLKQDILDEIKEIQSALPGSFNISKYYQEIFDITAGFQDVNGHILADELTEVAQEKIKKAHEKIEEAKQTLAKANGLTNSEYEELQSLYEKKNNYEITEEGNERLLSLLRKKKEEGLPAHLISRLNFLFSALRDISSTEYTDNYIYAWETQLSRMMAAGNLSDDFVQELNKEVLRGLNKEKINMLMADDVVMNTLMQDSGFATWFNRNHYKKNVYNTNINSRQDQFVPTYAWTYSKPTDKNAYRTTVIEETGEVINRVPNAQYTRRKVKEKYVTKREVGKTIDVWGNFLPDLSVPNNPFRNEAYFALEKSNPQKFAALNKYNNWYINKQLEAPVNSRLGYQIPRFTKDTLEFVQDVAGKKTSIADRLWRPIQEAASEVITDAADDIEKYSYIAPTLMVSDFVDDETSQVPIHGISSLVKERVSLNVAFAGIRYVNSITMQRNLIQSNPIAKSFVDVLEGSSDRTLATDSAKNNKHYQMASGVVKGAAAIVMGRNKGKRGEVSSRFKTVSDMYDREWLGQKLSSSSKSSRAAAKLVGTASKMASISYFAVNIPSALKNRIAAVVQTNIEAVGGNALTLKGYRQGKFLAGKAMIEISTTTTSRNPRSLLTNLAFLFNVDGGIAKTMDYTHRTLLRSTVSLDFLMAPRKFLQLEASLELLYGMMASKTIEVTENGQKKTIRLIDAYEMKNGSLVPKEGVPAEWGLTGKEFLRFRRLFDGKMNRLQGTYKEMQQPLLNRYALGRLVLFLRKYFVSMLMHRVAPYRPQYDIEGIDAGFYRSGIMFLANVVNDYTRRARTGNWDVSYSLNSEIEFEGAKKLGFETIQLAVLGTALRMLLMAMFGYDSEDPEKKKQKLLTGEVGPLWTPFNAETDREFKFNNWLAMHTALQLQLVSDEAMVFYPGSTVLDAMDANDLSETNLFSTFVQLDPLAAMWNGSVTRIKDIAGYGIGAMAGEEDAYFKRDVGPYWFQQADQPKVYQEMAKMIGINGKTVDPADAYLDWQAGLRLRK